MVEDYVNWKPTVAAHTCIKAVIENIPGELSTENNVAQENVTHFYTSASSPYKPVGLKIRVNNPFTKEETPVHFHVRDIPPGWTVAVEPTELTLPPGGYDFVRFTVYPPESQRPGAVGKPKIEALVPYADTYLPIGGVDAWVHLVKPTRLRLNEGRANKVQAGQRVTLTGKLTTLTGGLTLPLVNATVAVEFTAKGQREIRYAKTDASGRYEVNFTPPAAGSWKAQAFYSGDEEYAPAESHPWRFEVSGKSVPTDVIKFVIGHKGWRVGNQVFKADVAPFISKGRTFVPVRFLADSLGATTTWDGATRTVTILKQDVRITLRVGDKHIVVNGTPRPMDVSPMVRNNRVYLPARWVAEGLGGKVGWDALEQAVIIEPVTGKVQRTLISR